MRLAAMSFVGSCAVTSGDFCGVASPGYLATDQVADYIENDPQHEKWLIGINRFGEEKCGWKF
jgi:hypothetical protein